MKLEAHSVKCYNEDITDTIFVFNELTFFDLPKFGLLTFILILLLLGEFSKSSGSVFISSGDGGALFNFSALSSSYWAMRCCHRSLEI